MDFLLEEFDIVEEGEVNDQFEVTLDPPHKPDAPLDARSGFLYAAARLGVKKSTLQLMADDLRESSLPTPESVSDVMVYVALLRMAEVEGSAGNFGLSQALVLGMVSSGKGKVTLAEQLPDLKSLTKNGTIQIRGDQTLTDGTGGILTVDLHGRVIDTKGTLASRYTPKHFQGMWDKLSNVDGFSPALGATNLMRKPGGDSATVYPQITKASKAVAGTLMKLYSVSAEDKKNDIYSKVFKTSSTPSSAELKAGFKGAMSEVKEAIKECFSGTPEAVQRHFTAARLFRMGAPNASKSAATCFQGFADTTLPKQVQALSFVPGAFNPELQADYVFESATNPHFGEGNRHLATRPLPLVIGSGRDHLPFLTGLTVFEVDPKPRLNQAALLLEDVMGDETKFNAFSPLFSDMYSFDEAKEGNATKVKGAQGPGTSRALSVVQGLLDKMQAKKETPPVVITKIFCDTTDQHAYNTLCANISKLSVLYNFATLEGGRGHNGELYASFTKRSLPVKGREKAPRNAALMRLALVGEPSTPVTVNGSEYLMVKERDCGDYPEALKSFPYILLGDESLVIADEYRMERQGCLSLTDVNTILSSYYRVHAAKSVFRLYSEITCRGDKFNHLEVKKNFAPDTKSSLSSGHRKWEVSVSDDKRKLVPSVIRTFKSPVSVSANGEFIRAMVATEVETVQDDLDLQGGNEDGDLGDNEQTFSDIEE